MLHWHLPAKSFRQAAAVVLASQMFWGMALAADSSIGPVSEAESAILWKDSQKYYKSADYENAISRLKRLVDRYPGSPTATDYRMARFELGHCYFELKQDKEAIRTLKTYLEGPGEHPKAEEAREMLGLAQLRSKKIQEAYLTSLELEKYEAPETQAKAFLLRSQVWIARNQNEKAKASTVSALALAHQTQSKSLLGRAHELEFEIRTRECAPMNQAKRKPGREIKEESKVRSEIDTRGTCLTEALIPFRQSLTPEHSASADQAVSVAIQAFKDYRLACENPPNPPRLKPKDRTAEQLKRYRNELVDNLTQVYETHRKAALQMLINWKQENPPPSEFVQRRLQSLEESLK
jgi:tetratricopeptide (TPR) repeat protein